MTSDKDTTTRDRQVFLPERTAHNRENRNDL